MVLLLDLLNYLIYLDPLRYHMQKEYGIIPTYLFIKYTCVFTFIQALPLLKAYRYILVILVIKPDSFYCTISKYQIIVMHPVYKLPFNQFFFLSKNDFSNYITGDI